MSYVHGVKYHKLELDLYANDTRFRRIQLLTHTHKHTHTRVILRTARYSHSHDVMYNEADGLDTQIN